MAQYTIWSARAKAVVAENRGAPSGRKDLGNIANIRSKIIELLRLSLIFPGVSVLRRWRRPSVSRQFMIFHGPGFPTPDDCASAFRPLARSGPE